jgi:signal transduction histidine kinase
VFERFARLDASRSTDGGGTGLGLAISREIMVAHGGTVIATDVWDCAASR